MTHRLVHGWRRLGVCDPQAWELGGMMGVVHVLTDSAFLLWCGVMLFIGGQTAMKESELDSVLLPNALRVPLLPIRDAIDFVYSCIHCTIKALKFSSLAQICGGPIELAVITSDRPFRWVRHKDWDAAIIEGDGP